MNKEDIKVIDYVEKILSKKIEIITILSSGPDILHSLNDALLAADTLNPTRVILGDTYIKNNLHKQTDIVLTSETVGVTDHWCLIDKSDSNTVLNFYDKQEKLDKQNKETVVGYYTFSNTNHILECTQKAISQNKKEISDALEIYRKQHPLSAYTVDNWIDLGHTSGLIKLKHELFQTREFNSIHIDTQIGTLTKSSHDVAKLENEAYWYTELPTKFQTIVPRFISFEKKDGLAYLTQELYGYPTLAELYISGEVNTEDWCIILRKLFDLNKLLSSVSSTNENDILWLYKTKTNDRLTKLKQNPYWEKTLSYNHVIINNTVYNNLNLMQKNIYDYCKTLAANAKNTIIHGDFCFSNILFDPSNYLLKLIDPRGSINGKVSLYGDPRYDIAKLRHSVCNMYDLIVNDMFCLNENNGQFTFSTLYITDYSYIAEAFDELTKEYGYDINEIKFIEALLFLSMLPLHSDNITRQKALFIKAITLLNELSI